MASLRHPHVVLFLGVCYSPPAVITEFCSRGSLHDVLRGAQAQQGLAASLTWPRRLNLVRAVCVCVCVCVLRGPSHKKRAGELRPHCVCNLL